MSGAQILPTSRPRSYAGSFVANFTQAGGYSQTSTIKYRINNNTVTLRIQGFVGSATAAAAILSGATDLPDILRPANTIWFPVPVQDNAALRTTAGMIEIGSTGQIGLYKDLAAGSFTNGANAGLLVAGLSVAVSYLLD